MTDLTGNGRNATCVSCVISTQLHAINGSGSLMTRVTGSAGSSSIQFPVGSCPANHTMCFITRYRGAAATQKTILKNEVGGYFGHNTARRGIVNYGGNTIANGVTTAPVISYLNMCVSSSLPAPDYVLVNGVPNGIIGVAPISPFTSTLSINVNGGTETSGFELNQLIIWDRVLTSAEMTIVSNSFTKLLATGVLA